MKTWKQKGQEELQKQKYLDEIHVKPDVKKTFTLCEVFMFFDWISNLVFCTIMGIAAWKSDIKGMADAVDLYDVLENLLAAVGGTKTGIIIVVAYVLLKALLGRLKKKYQAKLQVFEDAGIIEIEKQVAEGTYVPGPTVSKAYRVYRDIRTWTTLIAVFGMLIGVAVNFLF